jgi:hypothetical protein
MKSPFKKLNFLIIFMLVASQWACKQDANNPDYANTAVCTDTNTTVSYTNAVKAIIDGNCATSGCHNTATSKDGITLEGYTNAKKAFESHSVLCAIHHGAGCDPMPNANTSLSTEQINKIDCWVKNGYKE